MKKPTLRIRFGILYRIMDIKKSGHLRIRIRYIKWFVSYLTIAQRCRTGNDFC